ncbi:hypothetical protein SNE40_017938 [Patella caerulea]|uniref:Uncharacterized protein n=1 Tax=Patella caerulea TaxID=87958 RepID=A0AAN8JJ63_PATCE
MIISPHIHFLLQHTKCQSFFLKEKDKLQSLLNEIESYNSQTQTEISKSDCKVEIKDASVKTSSDIELETEKDISKRIDELGDALERRKEPLLNETDGCDSEVFKGDCEIEMKIDFAKTSSGVEIEAE